MAENLALVSKYTTEVHSSMRFNDVQKEEYWENIARQTDLNNKHQDTIKNHGIIENFFPVLQELKDR